MNHFVSNRRLAQIGFLVLASLVIALASADASGQTFNVTIAGSQVTTTLTGRVVENQQSRNDVFQFGLNDGQVAAILRWDGYAIDQFYTNEYRIVDKNGRLVFHGVFFNQLNVIVGNTTDADVRTVGPWPQSEDDPLPHTYSFTVGPDKFDTGGTFILSLKGSLTIPFVQFRADGNTFYSAYPKESGSYTISIPFTVTRNP